MRLFILFGRFRLASIFSAYKKPSIRFFAFTLVLAVVLGFEYGESFSFYFVGDDFMFIRHVQEKGLGILWTSPSPSHFYPLGTLAIALPACFGVLEPHWFGLVNFLLFFLSAILVMILYKRIAGSLLGGFFAALIYSTAVPNSEVIYWKTGNATIAMTCFSAIAFILFVRFLQNGSRKSFLGCIAAFAASMLCIEQGIMTFGILFLYDLIFFSVPQWRATGSTRKLIAKRFLCRHGTLLLVPLLLTTLKLAIGKTLMPIPLAHRSVSRLIFLATEAPLRLVDFNNIIFPSFRSLMGKPGQMEFVPRILIFLFLVFVLGYTLKRRNTTSLFFLFSAVGSFVGIAVSANAISPRYFNLPLVFYACFLSSLAQDVTGLLRTAFRRRASRKPREIEKEERLSIWVQQGAYVVCCLTIVWFGMRGTLEYRAYWKLASLIESNIVESVEGYYNSRLDQNRPEQTIYLLDVPEFLWSDKYFSRFYVTGGSLVWELRYRLGAAADSIKFISTYRNFQMTTGDKYIAYQAYGAENGELVREGDIKKLIDDSHVVLRFSPDVLDVVPLDRLGDGSSECGSARHAWRWLERWRSLSRLHRGCAPPVGRGKPVSFQLLNMHHPRRSIFQSHLTENIRGFGMYYGTGRCHETLGNVIPDDV
jgi:hypothetical protein